MGAVFWVIGEASEIIIQGCIESGEFHALKVK